MKIVFKGYILIPFCMVIFQSDLSQESLQGMDCGVFVGCCNLGGNDVDPEGSTPQFWLHHNLTSTKPAAFHMPL